MKQKNIFGIVAFSMILLLCINSVSAFGFGWFDKSTDQDTIKQEQESLQTAVENNDYSTWKSVMEGIIERMKSLITEENFQKAVEQNTEMETIQEEQESLQTAIENNDYDTWKSLMEAKITEDAFNDAVERYTEMSEKEDSDKKPQMNEADEELQTAIENNDYDTWKSLMEAKITEDAFNDIVERYTEMKDNQGQQKPTEDQKDSPRAMNHGPRGNNLGFGMGFGR